PNYCVFKFNRGKLVGNIIIKNSKKILDRIFLSNIPVLYISIFLIISFISADLRSESCNWINVAVRGKPATFQVWEMNDVVATVIVKNNIFEGLVAYDEKGLKVKPHLAESWEIEQGGKVWIFNIRKGVMFHDGTLLTADDVVESIRKNIYFSGEIEKAGPMSVRFILPVKNTQFIKVLGRIDFLLEKVKTDGSIVGTGPFVLEEWDGSNEIKMRTFRDYWGKLPTIDGVIFHCMVKPEESLAMMRQGKLDVIYTFPPCMARDVESDNGLVLSVLEGASICYVHINPERSPLNGPEFRRAINLAIDRKEIIREIYCGGAMYPRRFLPPVIGSVSKELGVMMYNPEEAKRIINKHMVDKKRTFKMVGLPFPRPYCPDPEALARMIIGYLEDVGLETKYTPTNSWENWLEMAKGNDYDFLISGWVLDSMSPDEFYTSIFGLGGIEHIYGSDWENDLFESFILQAGKTISIRSSWDLYKKAEDLLFHEYPWVMIVHPNRIGVYRNGITGIKFSPIAEFSLGNARKCD
ncbi:ABC transporter substrate-binding protein, partial [bacterium]|nr:ABC transporter substrate-binding protein [bacterium]